MSANDVLARNPPYTGSLVPVTTLGGSGGGYNDTQVRALIAQNTAAIATKAATTAMNAADEPSRLCLDLVTRLDAAYDDPVVPMWMLDPFATVDEDMWLVSPMDVVMPCSD